MPARLRRANRTRAVSPPGRVHDWAITPTLQPFGLHIIIPNQPAPATEYPRQWHFSGGHDARRVLRQGFALLAASGDRKSVRANHPPDGPPSLFAHLSGGTLRVPISRGPAVHGPSPFVASRHFPHAVGESSRAPAESPLPAPVGALFVRHWRTAPF